MIACCFPVNYSLTPLTQACPWVVTWTILVGRRWWLNSHHMVMITDLASIGMMMTLARGKPIQLALKKHANRDPPAGGVLDGRPYST